MKNDEMDRRIAPPVDRSVQYRPARPRPGMDVMPMRARPADASVGATPTAPAATTPVVASAVAAPKPVETGPSPAATRTASVDSPSPISQAPPSVAAPKINRFKRFSQRAIRPAIGSVAAIAILGITGYVAFDTWISNNVVEKTTPSIAAVQGESTAVLEGSDENIVPQSAINSYVVAADMPRVLTIDKLNVRARVLPMGVTATSAIQAPINIFDSGWYTGSARPGTPGVSFIDAHASGSTREGLFAYLDTLKAGDIITIERGDGEVLKYAVRSLETQALADIKMTQVLSPKDGIKEGLTIMTCTGKWQADKETYDHRVIVYTERI